MVQITYIFMVMKNKIVWDLGWCTTAMERCVVMLHTSSAISRTSPGVDIESISISMRSTFLSAGAV